jgi:pSer/pThr/pTyr-binding forkhead associated (FHA) protein
MQDQEKTGEPLWTCGEMILKVQAAARGSTRIVHIRRPFARLGRALRAEITISALAASDQHVYLHLDPRGVYAVDLDTRTGTCINGTWGRTGWLRPGHWLEVAGRRVELLQARIDGREQDPPPCDADLLADTGPTTLVGVALQPGGTPGNPWVLDSELVFSGRSAACGIPIHDRTVARTHAALLRTKTAAYVINLSGHRTWIDGRPVRGASIIHDGQILTLGSTRFVASVEPAWSNETKHEVVINPEASNESNFAVPFETISPDSRRAMAQLLHLIQQEHASLLAASHLDWIESVDCDLDELQRQGAHAGANPPAALLPPPRVTPLHIARAAANQTGAPMSTTWLLERLGQLKSQNRSAWRALLDRLVVPPHRTT